MYHGYSLQSSDPNALTLNVVRNAPFVIKTNNTERSRILGSGEQMIGATTARTMTAGASMRLQVETSDASAGLSVTRNVNSTSGGNIRILKTRGTTNGAVTVVQSGDSLGQIQWFGSDGTGTIQAAEIRAEVDGTPGTNDMPGRLAFYTTADGASSSTERMRITSSGQVIVQSSDLVVPKTSGVGIKVDPTTPTFPWHDILSQITVRGTGANDPSWNVFRGGIRAYQFGSNDEVWAQIHLPHDYAPGTDVYFHVHWAHNSATVTSGGVTWTFEMTYAKGHNQAAFSAPVTTTVTQTASTVQYQHMIAETVISTPGGSATLLNSSLFEPDGVILIRIALTGNTMSAATDPFAFLTDGHYQSTNIGTKQKAPNFYV